MSMSSGFVLAAFNCNSYSDDAVPHFANASEKHWFQILVRDEYGVDGLKKLLAGDFVNVGKDWVIWKIVPDKPKVDPTIEAREQAQRQARKARGRTEWQEGV